MARVNPTRLTTLAVTTNGGIVESMTLGGEPLPLRHILSYTVTQDAMDIPRVTVTFMAKAVIRDVTPDDDGSSPNHYEGE